MRKIDTQRSTYNKSVLANFVEESRSSAQESNTDTCTLDYFGHILEIMKIHFKKFEIFVFVDVEWFKVIVRGPNATMCKDKSKLIYVNSRKFWQDEQDTFVLQAHSEKVVFVNEPKWIDAHERNVDKPKWKFIFQVAPRGKQVCKDLDVEDADPS